MRYMPDSPPPARKKAPQPDALASTHWCATQPADSLSGALSQSFLADLRRFEDQPSGCGMLAALAASVRHNRNVALHLWGDEGQVVTLKVYPRERWVQCNLDLTALSEPELAKLQLSHAEGLPPLREAMPVCATDSCGPLGPLLWQLATLGPAHELLPEIAGTAKYRLAPAPHLDELPTTAAMARLLSCLRGPPATVRALAHAAGCETQQVHRFLNALYLQSALMVTRSCSAN